MSVTTKNTKDTKDTKIMEEVTGTTTAEQIRVVEAVRAACVQAALDGFEQASFDGLCCEGAWECAVSAIRNVNLESFIQAVEPVRE